VDEKPAVVRGARFRAAAFRPGSGAPAVLGFTIFCALSGVVYLVNDVADRESDRQHPLKKRQADCRRYLPLPMAIGAAAVIAAAALAAAFAMSWRFGLVAATYLALQGLARQP
jgi:4-hydroxybenzoate polyprenyltransferase